jgi:SAM-dependent methyltransferase
MLEDHRRTGAYFRAVRNNARQFKDKVVLDVGTGSGILALFAAQAGAKVVYAVEATSMAKHARALVEANGYGGVVQVIQGTIETAELPEKVRGRLGGARFSEKVLAARVCPPPRRSRPGEKKRREKHAKKRPFTPLLILLHPPPPRQRPPTTTTQVDIIISEWMGYFLLRESMLDSVLLARDRWLKPGGALYPSHARMLLAPCRTPQSAQRASDFHSAMEGWGEFAGDMARLYGVDLRCLSESYRGEQREYFLRTAAWADVHPSQLMGPGVALGVVGGGAGGAAGAGAAAAAAAATNGGGNGASGAEAAAKAKAPGQEQEEEEELDLLKVQVGQLKDKALEASATLSFSESGRAEGLVGWFDVSFRGSPENPADDPVVLTTEPDADGATHWGQQLFHVHPPLQVVAGERVALRMRLSRREDNHRLLKVQFCLQAPSSGGGGGGASAAPGGGGGGSMPPGAARTLDYQIE